MAQFNTNRVSCLLVCLFCWSWITPSLELTFPNKLRCWRCVDATSDADCFKKGKWVQCKTTQNCYVEQRYENGLEIHKRGCKQHTACNSLAAQNEFQCSGFLSRKFIHESRSNPITCRHCCNSNYCNPTRTAKITMQKLKRKSPPRPVASKATRTTPGPTRPTTKAIVEQEPVEPLIPGKEVNLGEVFYPKVGWVALSQVKNQRPAPGVVFADDPNQLNRGNVSEEVYNFMNSPVEELRLKKQERIKKWKEYCTSAKNPILPQPKNFSPKEECVIQPASSCIEDGTIILRLYKTEHEEESIDSDEDGKCKSTPSVDTAVVYDNEDHYMMVIRLKQRQDARLPVKQPGQYFIGEERLNNVISRKELHRYRGGRG